MKKRFFLAALTLIFTYSMAIAQASLLNQTTNGLFHNVNDFVIKPNIMFNTVNAKQIIVGGGFDTMGFQSKTTGGGLLGYYHPGSFRWSVVASLDMDSPLHIVQQETPPDENIQYMYPTFTNYNGGVRFTFGLPDVMNLSAGLLVRFQGVNSGPEKTITITDGAETATIVPHTKTLNLQIGIPVGLEINPSLYNYAEPVFHIHQITTIQQESSNTPASHKDTTVSFMFYDKLTVQDLLPAPFGSETAFWIGIGNAQLHAIDSLETPAYDAQGAIGYKVNFSTQLGASNLMDLSLGDAQLRFKPMAYLDLMTGEHKSFTFGITVAASAGTYVPLGNLPLAMFFGVTPRLQFYTSTYGTENQEAASRALTTNVFWTGKIGTSILLPQDMVLDVTFNVNTHDKSLGLSAQMSVAL